MKILITGGSGFIGTNLVEKFVSENNEVLNCDILPPKKKSHLKFWENVDIRKKKDLAAILTQFNPEYIIHLAARTDLNGKKGEDYDSNVLGTKNIMEIAEKLPNIKKVIFTSSMLVCSTGYKPKNLLDYHPSTLYGKSKVIGENLIMDAKLNYEWAIIRPTSIWGPWFGEPYRNFFDMVLARRYFHIGHCSCTKTYGYVGNAVYEIEKIMLTDTRNRIFYIGDYIPTNIEEWANEIAEQLGYKILRVPYWIVKGAAIVGDLLKKINIKFPMTSFRLKNMTTDNVVEMEETQKIAGSLPYQRVCGIKETIKWMKGNRI